MTKAAIKYKNNSGKFSFIAALMVFLSLVSLILFTTLHQLMSGKIIINNFLRQIEHLRSLQPNNPFLALLYSNKNIMNNADTFLQNSSKKIMPILIAITIASIVLLMITIGVMIFFEKHHKRNTLNEKSNNTTSYTNRYQKDAIIFCTAFCFFIFISSIALIIPWIIKIPKDIPSIFAASIKDLGLKNNPMQIILHGIVEASFKDNDIVKNIKYYTTVTLISTTVISLIGLVALMLWGIMNLRNIKAENVNANFNEINIVNCTQNSSNPKNEVKNNI